MFCIKLCRVLIELDNRYQYVGDLCRDYIYEPQAGENPAFRVAVSEVEVRDYRLSVHREMTCAEAESYLLYRKICGKMPKYGAFLLHAAVVSVGGRGYAFSARRGVGKTTRTALWEQYFDAEIVNESVGVFSPAFAVIGRKEGGNAKSLGRVCFGLLIAIDDQIAVWHSDELGVLIIDVFCVIEN